MTGKRRERRKALLVVGIGLYAVPVALFVMIASMRGDLSPGLVAGVALLAATAIAQIARDRHPVIAWPSDILFVTASILILYEGLGALGASSAARFLFAAVGGGGCLLVYAIHAVRSKTLREGTG